MRTPLFAVILAAALPSVVLADAFTAPRPGTVLDLSNSITVAWEKPKKPSDEWTGLVNVSASLNWARNGSNGAEWHDIAVNRPNDSAGEVRWDPRELREFLEVNCTTCTAEVYFSATYNKIPSDQVTDGHQEGMGWLTDQFRIEGHDALDTSGAGGSEITGLAVFLGAIAQCFLVGMAAF